MTPSNIQKYDTQNSGSVIAKYLRELISGQDKIIAFKLLIYLVNIR